MGRQQREKWVVRQPRTEALIAPSGLQGCEKISFCRLNPESGTWSRQPRDDSGLSGRPAIARHHRKGKAQQRRGTHPVSLGTCPGAPRRCTHRAAAGSMGRARCGGGGRPGSARTSTDTVTGSRAPARGSHYPVEAVGQIQSLLSSAPSLPGENSGRGSRGARQELEKHRPPGQPPPGRGRRRNIWPAAFP